MKYLILTAILVASCSSSTQTTQSTNTNSDYDACGVDRPKIRELVLEAQREAEGPDGG